MKGTPLEPRARAPPIFFLLFSSVLSLMTVAIDLTCEPLLHICISYYSVWLFLWMIVL